MSPILSKSDAAALVVAARIRHGLSWSQIADRIGAPLVWCTAALLGQHPMSREQAQGVCALLEPSSRPWPRASSCSPPAGRTPR